MEVNQTYLKNEEGEIISPVVSTDSVYTADDKILSDVLNKLNTGLKIYGVKREIESSDSAWERIEDSVGLEANATHDGSYVKNDFDDLYPWSGIISYTYDSDTASITSYYGDINYATDGTMGDVFTCFPSFYWKRIQEDGYEYIYIANKDPLDDTFTKSEPFSIARYPSTSQYNNPGCSVSGVQPAGYEITQSRTYAQARGYQLMDIWCWSLLQILYLVEYADYNSQDKLGLGAVNGSNDESAYNGSCDFLGMYSGCSANDGYTSVCYRGVENIYGLIACCCDGVAYEYSTGKVYLCTDPNLYYNNAETISDDYVSLDIKIPTSGGYITKIGYDENFPLIQLPIACGGGSSSTYITDTFWSISTSDECNKYLRVGGYAHYGSYFGMWHGGFYISDELYGNSNIASGMYGYRCQMYGKI